MSGLFPDDAYDGPAQPAPPRPQRRRALLYTAIVMIVTSTATKRVLRRKTW